MIKNLGSLRSIFKDSKNKIWLATSTGLYLYPTNGEEFIRITPYNLELCVPNYYFIRVAEDKDGNIWATSKQGVAKVDTSNLSFSIIPTTTTLDPLSIYTGKNDFILVGYQ